ncbi:hypothetical protein QL285_069663 [Trifolium repens]|nr:hypothetical protein QL285_069663 [Trifolium repens]
MRKRNDPADPPFSFSVYTAPLPAGFQVPSIKAYDGSSDPDDHLKIYYANMLVYGFTDAIMCRAFPATLIGPALRWFYTLTPHSISKFSQLTKKFLSHFVLSKTSPRLPVSLKRLKQGTDESLKDYLDRFNQEAIQVDDDLSTELSIHIIQAGLKPGIFKESLVQEPPLNLRDISNRAAHYDKQALQHCNKRQRDLSSQDESGGITAVI